MIERFLFIVNPTAGRGSARAFEGLLRAHLEALRADHRIVQTEGPGHATELARLEKETDKIVVAVGGDGTAHEVASGLLNGKAYFSALPAGSGNDFAHLLGFNGTFSDNLRALMTGKDSLCDVGTYVIRSAAGKEHRGRFINSLGIGLDAAISYSSRRIRYLKGIPLYLLATIKTLRTFRALPLTVEVNGETFRKNYFLVCVGNGHHEGGGFSVTPGARPNDGKFEICTVQDMPISNAVRLIPRVLAGSHGNFPGIAMHNATSITVRAQDPFYVHCDGEIPAADAIEVKVGLMESALRVRVSAGSRYF